MKTPLDTLQTAAAGVWFPEVDEAAEELSRYHVPTEDQAERHQNLAASLETFLLVLVMNAPAGPERSTAISRAREAKFWASAAIALEPQAEEEK